MHDGRTVSTEVASAANVASRRRACGSARVKVSARPASRERSMRSNERCNARLARSMCDTRRDRNWRSTALQQ